MENETREFISLLFEGYKSRKKRNVLYRNEDNVPKIIISEYINLVEKPAFKDLITSYKKRYIFCESRVETNISKEEQAGLGKVYDFINDFDFEKNNFNVFITSLIMHHELYSCCGDGTFGGKLRDTSAFLHDLNIEILPPREAIKVFNSYIAKKDYIFDKYNKGDIFGYIEDCVKLSADLIKLQPFADGNKRTFRALLNLLFKRLNIPPVYIEIEERQEYKKALIKAMQAQTDDDYKDLIQFYHYKICDSIITLDIHNSELANMNIFDTKKSR